MTTLDQEIAHLTSAAVGCRLTAVHLAGYAGTDGTLGRFHQQLTNLEAEMRAELIVLRRHAGEEQP